MERIVERQGAAASVHRPEAGTAGRDRSARGKLRPSRACV